MKQWFLCENCHKVIESSELKYTNFNHNCPVEIDPGPDYNYCPYCRSDDLTELHTCSVCKMLKEVVTKMEDGNYLCEDCSEDDYWRLAENGC